ncbi:MAG TPA: hypothetical protein VHF07_07810 [Nitrospiraceae bacterium]|nr:hypothetical protein [Nitrospiraceae bacterium]
MLTCPNANCARELVIEPHVQKTEPAAPDAGKLHAVRCSYCGHAGFLIDCGLHLVFRTGQQFCFTIGTTPAYLTIAIPAAALYAYQSLGFGQEALARYAAEWLLLRGHKNGIFTLVPDQPIFAGFKEYLETRVSSVHPHVA